MKAYKETVRKYYKYGTTPNVTIVGSPTIINGVASGFSTANYLKITQIVPLNSANNWEMRVKFKVNSFANEGTIYSEQGNIAYNSKFDVNTNGKIYYLASNTHSDSFNVINITGNTTLSLNTWYWLKAVFTGSAYNFYLSTNGNFNGEEILDGTVTSSAKLLNYEWGLGSAGRTDQYHFPLDGSIDLSECHIKINDQDWWHGTLAEESTSSDYDFYENVDTYELYKETIRKYYKFISWAQPVFTSAITWGNVWADNYFSDGSINQYPWQALDDKTSGGNEADFAASGTNRTDNWYWNFAEPLKISAIKIWNRANANNYGGDTDYTIYGKNEDSSYEQIGTLFLAATAWISGTTNISSTKRYYGIKIYCSGNKNNVGIGEILLTAYTSQESTSSDYDYYKDIDVYKAFNV